MARLTDTQLIILSAASQRDDRGVELSANLKGEAARKVVDKLIRAGLLEEVRAGGTLPVWRRGSLRALRGLYSYQDLMTDRRNRATLTLPDPLCGPDVPLWLLEPRTPSGLFFERHHRTPGVSRRPRRHWIILVWRAVRLPHE
jgi:hypothetical protein